MRDVLRTRLQLRLEATNMTPRAASLAAGLGPDFIRDLQRRTENSPLSSSVHQIAQVLGTNSAYLMGETDQISLDAPAGARKPAGIRKLAIEPAFGGEGGRVISDPEAPALVMPQEDVDALLDGRAENGRYLVIEGDSYVDVLKSGDRVVVNLTLVNPMANAGIYCLYHGGALAVRRLQMTPEGDRIRVLSDNARYAGYDVEGGRAQIVGRVVWRAGAL